MLDFTKLNMDEIQAYCKSDKAIINFQLLPSFMIIQEIAIILASYGVTEFSAEDIKELFTALDMHNEKGRSIIPSRKKIAGVLETQPRNSIITLTEKDGIFTVTKFDDSGYRCEVERLVACHHCGEPPLPRRVPLFH